MVSQPPISPGTWWAARLFGVGMAAVGGLLAWAGWLEVVIPLREMSAGVPLVEFQPIDAVTPPLALSFFSLALLSFVPPPPPRSRKRGKAAPRDWSKVATSVFSVACAGALLTVVAVPIARVAVPYAFTVHGYAVCPPPAIYHRRAPMRFAISTASCP